MKQKEYKKYKPSGVEWIGNIPDHWKTFRLKYVAEVNPSNIDKKSNEGEEKVLLCNYVDVYKNEFITKELQFMEATASKQQILKFELKKGDLLATKDSEDPKDIAVPAVVKENLPGIVCGYHLTHIRPINDILDGFYLHRLFLSYTFNQQFTIKANGVTRFGLPAAAFTEAVICCPPITEQQAIASYLDEKTAIIDETIRKKEKLIELLEEERTAIINQAVTRGLGKYVKLKDSGVEWLGEIPTHWEVKKLKYICNLQSGDTITAERISPEGLYPVYGGNGLRGYTDTYTHTGSYPLIGRQGALCGNINYGNGDFFASEHAVVVTPQKNIEVMWLGELLRVMNLGQYSVSAAQPGLSVEILKQLHVPVAPQSEQIMICEWIKKLTTEIDETIKNCRNMTTLLKEYRATLINEVVTGKICIN